MRVLVNDQRHAGTQVEGVGALMQARNLPKRRPGIDAFGLHRSANFGGSRFGGLFGRQLGAPLGRLSWGGSALRVVGGFTDTLAVGSLADEGCEAQRDQCDTLAEASEGRKATDRRQSGTFKTQNLRDFVSVIETSRSLTNLKKIHKINTLRSLFQALLQTQFEWR